MTTFLSIVSALTGLVIVGPLSSYLWSKILLNQALSSRAALLEFWNRRFKDCRGVMGLLLSENPNWPKPKIKYCRAVIWAEYETFRRLRRHALIAFAFFAAIWIWASSHFSPWILFWFLVSILASATANRKRGCEDALSNIFRCTRLWMWADPTSLKENAEWLRISGVVNLLREVETTEDPKAHPMDCLCDECLSILEDE